MLVNLLLVLALVFVGLGSPTNPELTVGEKRDVNTTLTTFCYTGLPPWPWLGWNQLYLNLSHTPERIFYHFTPEDANNQHEELNPPGFLGTLWDLMKLSPEPHSTVIAVPTFERHCVKVKMVPKVTYSVHLINQFSMTHCVSTLVALALFFAAPYMAHSVAFYYSGGITVSLCLSVLLLLLILHRYLPFKRIITSLLVFSTTVFTLAVNFFSEKCLEVISLHWHFFIGYCLVVAFVSAMFLVWQEPYIFGNVRFRQLLQVSVQGVSLMVLWHSMNLAWLRATLVGSLLVWALVGKVLPSRAGLWFSRMRSWFPMRKRQRNYFTPEQYRRVVRRCTRDSLEELRDAYTSLSCSPWKVKNLSRVAEFANGGLHVSQEEIIAYKEYMSHLDDSDSTEDHMNGSSSSPYYRMEKVQQGIHFRGSPRSQHK